MDILCIIPARSGSKGLRNKNIQKINGSTLIEIAYNVAKKSKIFKNIILSTDSKKYLQVIRDKNLEKPFLRPKKLASDKATDLQLMIYELKKYEAYFKKKYDYICLLQPSSPLRKIKHIKSCYEILRKYKPNAIWTVSDVDNKFHPIKQVYAKNNYLKYCDTKGKNFVSRQDLKKTYIRNGVAYFFSRNTILKKKKILPNKTRFFLINKNKVANIDSKQDLVFARNKFIKI
jgi:CMP-N,N'-diacetyllegionaminic acid synthase